jgi:hypothetical protein
MNTGRKVAEIFKIRNQFGVTPAVVNMPFGFILAASDNFGYLAG